MEISDADDVPEDGDDRDRNQEWEPAPRDAILAPDDREDIEDDVPAPFADREPDAVDRPSEGVDVSAEIARWDGLRERIVASVGRMPDVLRYLGRRSGGVTRRAATAAVVASVGAPVVAAAVPLGPVVVAILNQLGAFGAGYLTNLFFEWHKHHPRAPFDEDTIRRALADMLALQRQPDGMATEAGRHFATLLADPTILGAVVTVAADSGRELKDLRPAGSDPADDDAWLLEEVIEALDDLARQPNPLEAALCEAYARLSNDRGGS